MVAKALRAKRGALHELVAELAAVAPQGERDVDPLQVFGAMEDVDGLALWTDVVGDVQEFSLGAGVGSVMSLATLPTEERSLAKSSMGQTITPSTGCVSIKACSQEVEVAIPSRVVALADVTGWEKLIRMLWWL